MADVQFLREAIECRTVSLAAQRVTPADARELRRQLKQQARVAARGDHAAFVPLDDRMHQKLVAMAGRPRVWRAVEDAKAQLDRVRFLSLEDPAWLATIHRQHEDIVERVLAGDAAGAVGRDVAASARRVRVDRDDRPHEPRVFPQRPGRAGRPSGLVRTTTGLRRSSR